MKILIAEDNVVSRRLLIASLAKWGYDDTVVACDGMQAWETLRADDAPALAILDWMMPKMDGLEVCRRVRALEGHPVYLIMVTTKNRHGDVVRALEAGVDDYVAKPFDHAELRARLRCALRVIKLQRHLADHVDELQTALSRVKQLEGLIPICSYCKRVRNDEHYWQQVEAYVTEHSRATFSHSICPDCSERVLNDLLLRGGEASPPCEASEASAGAPVGTPRTVEPDGG